MERDDEPTKAALRKMGVDAAMRACVAAARRSEPATGMPPHLLEHHSMQCERPSDHNRRRLTDQAVTNFWR